MRHIPSTALGHTDGQTDADRQTGNYMQIHTETQRPIHTEERRM